VIAVSASAFSFHTEQSLQIGCADFIAKPFKIDEIFEVLQKHLALTWKHAESSPPGEVPLATNENISSVVDPTSDQATTLYHLAMRGDISGIQAECKKLLAEDAALQPFLDKILKFAENYDADEICTLLEPYLNSSSFEN